MAVITNPYFSEKTIAANIIREPDAGVRVYGVSLMGHSHLIDPEKHHSIFTERQIWRMLRTEPDERVVYELVKGYYLTDTQIATALRHDHVDVVVGTMLFQRLSESNRRIAAKNSEAVRRYELPKHERDIPTERKVYSVFERQHDLLVAVRSIGDEKLSVDEGDKVQAEIVKRFKRFEQKPD